MLDRSTEAPPMRERMLADVLDGLSDAPKRIPGKYLWDEAGSELFDRICATEDYYLTRRELALLAAAAPEVADAVGPAATLVEYGSGASRKVRLLLDALPAPRAYLAIDISAEYLDAATRRLAADYPGLAVRPLVADYTAPIALPAGTAPPILGFFPGSTIGNFDEAGVAAFLGRARDTIGAGWLLVGHDPNRDAARLERAYGGADGLMAALHLNLLAHLNRALDADFDLANFRHTVRVEDDPPRVEAGLVVERPASYAVGGRRVEFAAGERIHTDSSYKMDPARFLALAARAGWAGAARWDDPDGLYALHLLRTA